MKPYVTCEQMKLLEKAADAAGLSYYQMMENAGTRAFELICDNYPENPADSKPVIFCGKGNNGGDGFVVARKLHELGAAVTVILTDGEPVTPDAVTNYNLIKDFVSIIHIGQLKETETSLIIDAVYGTGFHGRLKPSGLIAANWINSRNTYVAALDIPSGLSGDADNLSVCDSAAVKADITITFHNRKPVHLQDFAAEYCGKILVADIGIDEDKLDI